MDSELPTTDVAVIGAGPGGSVAAALMARKGTSTILIDRDTFPRDKLCGGFVSYDAIPIFELLDVLAPGNLIDSVRIIAGRTLAAFTLPHAARALSRDCLDQLLLNVALAAGARALLGWTAIKVTFNGAYHLLTLRQGTHEQRVQARVVLGAWGRWSSLAGSLSPRGRRRFGIAQYVAPRPVEFRHCVDLYASDHGYVGLAEVDANRSNVCGLVSEQLVAALAGRLATWLPVVSCSAPLLHSTLQLPTPTESGIRVSSPVVFGVPRPVIDHVLTIGDAAVVLPPVIGSGITTSMQIALLAAEYANRILREPGVRSALEAQYTGEVKHLVARRHRWAGSLAGIMTRPRLCEGLLRMSGPRILRDVIVRKTRSDVDDVHALTSRWRHSHAG